MPDRDLTPYDLTVFKGMVPRTVDKQKPGTGQPKPKRNRRTAASPERIAEIRAKKCQECRLCGKTANVTAHHLVPRSQGGQWVAWNIVGLCGSGTTGCHGLIEARDKAACYLLRARLTDHEYSFLVQHMGEGWLDRKYPALPEEGAA